MKLEIPEALRLGEAAICTGLHRAAETRGETGQAAELLEAILLPHLAKERVVAAVARSSALRKRHAPL